jgi:uncharacterized membrane protein SpoIIM required for sporulation
MVFEDLLNRIGKRKIYSFFIGLLYVFISYGTSKAFFPSSISLPMTFFITLLLVPSTARLLSIEEKIERKDGLKNFFKDHSVLMEIFLFLFLGIFIGYLIVGSYAPDSLSYQNKFLEGAGINEKMLDNKVEKGPQFFGILQNNISVIVIAFILSIFYGVGALFLIVLNASIFAGFILSFSQIAVQNTILSASLLSIHFVPEVFGFLLAAMAGGVISKAVVNERFGTRPFKNVIKDGTILLILGILLIIASATIEVFITPGLIRPLT